MKTLLLVTFSFLIVLSISAEEEKKLYKWVDQDGNTQYSDQPRNGAEEIEMKLAPVTKMLPPKYNLPEIKNSNTLDNDDASYHELSFVIPTDNGVVRNNSNSINLEALVSPQLKSDHSIRFFVDGRLISTEPGLTTAMASDVEFGEHSASFTVVDSAGKAIQSSETIHFHLLNRVNPKIRQQQNNP